MCCFSWERMHGLVSVASSRIRRKRCNTHDAEPFSMEVATMTCQRVFMVKTNGIPLHRSRNVYNLIIVWRLCFFPQGLYACHVYFASRAHSVRKGSQCQSVVSFLTICLMPLQHEGNQTYSLATPVKSFSATCLSSALATKCNILNFN